MDEMKVLLHVIETLHPDLPDLVGAHWPEFQIQLNAYLDQFHQNPDRLPILRAYILARAGDSRGSSRFLGLRSRAEVRIPAPEGVLPLLVEYAGSYLQEEMRSTLAPSHLLFLHHSLAHYLIDR